MVIPVIFNLVVAVVGLIYVVLVANFLFLIGKKLTVINRMAIKTKKTATKWCCVMP